MSGKHWGSTSTVDQMFLNFIMEVIVKRLLILAGVGISMVGCVPAEYKCPEGLIPTAYTRHTDHAMTGIGRQVEVHTSDLACERFKEDYKKK
jgi:hypothetical protein